jgi:hypothetical protein
MAYTTTDEQFVVFKAKHPFQMFYKIKTGKVWVRADA